MCLAVPGKILSITGDSPFMLSGKVDFAGVQREVSLAFVPEAVVGDYVIVHAGCAIRTLNEAEAQRTLEKLAHVDALLHDTDAELGEGLAS